MQSSQSNAEARFRGASSAAARAHAPKTLHVQGEGGTSLTLSKNVLSTPAWSYAMKGWMHGSDSVRMGLLHGGNICGLSVFSRKSPRSIGIGTDTSVSGAGGGALCLSHGALAHFVFGAVERIMGNLSTNASKDQPAFVDAKAVKLYLTIMLADEAADLPFLKGPPFEGNNFVELKTQLGLDGRSNYVIVAAPVAFPTPWGVPSVAKGEIDFEMENLFEVMHPAGKAFLTVASQHTVEKGKALINNAATLALVYPPGLDSSMSPVADPFCSFTLLTPEEKEGDFKTECLEHAERLQYFLPTAPISESESPKAKAARRVAHNTLMDGRPREAKTSGIASQFAAISQGRTAQARGQDILKLNMGNPHALGEGPITYYRQILASCELPSTVGVDHPCALLMFPSDVVARAKEYRSIITPYGGMGAYTEPQGILEFREHVALFIEARDGHASNPQNIFLTNGASNAIELVLTALISSKNDAIMTPIYHYPLYLSLINKLGGSHVSYEMCEDEGWKVTKESLERSYESAVSQGLVVKAMSIINPGNPIGYCLDRVSLEVICDFCAHRKIILLSDEVYQQNTYNGSQFISAKKVCCDSLDHQERLGLISFHSSSKGTMSECGKRGGYMELHNICQRLQRQILKLASETLPCANTTGQVMVSLLTTPPLPHDASYSKFLEESSGILASLTNRMTLLANGLNKIDGITCQQVEGSLYLFPAVKLPRGALKAANVAGKTPDEFYCTSLLQQTGISVAPASSFGGCQENVRYGFRITCVFPDEKLPHVIESVSKHHIDFCQLYGGSDCIRTEPAVNCNKVNLKCLDHYTLICEDAEQVAKYHTRHLGFKFLRTIDLNTGTVEAPGIDMKNYVLEPPGNPHMSVVITEGLNDDTVFRKYMKKYGSGIHHVAFEIDNIEEAFKRLKANGIKTTSEKVTSDMLSGLKQFFIDPSHAGFFIELIERPSTPTPQDCSLLDKEQEDAADHHHHGARDNIDHSFFTTNNMSDLAKSMHNLLSSRDDSSKDSPDENLDARSSSSSPATVTALPTAADLDIDIGPIRMIGFAVENRKAATEFLLDSFNLRFVRHKEDSSCNPGITYVRPYGDVKHDFLLSIREALSQHEQRDGFVNFSVSEVQMRTPEVQLSKVYTSYHAILCSEESIAKSSCIVDCFRKDTVDRLTVHINVSQECVLSFLVDPSNLTSWTGHKTIRYVEQESRWVETRLNDAGSMVNFTLCVERDGTSIAVIWPERGVSFKLETKETSIGTTELTLSLPPSATLKYFSQLRRIIDLELNLLKAILEGNTACIPDHIFSQIYRHHLTIYGTRVPPLDIDAFIFYQNGFQGQVIVEGPMFELMTTDFALTKHTIPLAILRPANLEDVKIGIRLAKEFGVPFVVRGSQVSHSAGGQAQSKGILLDISSFNSVEMCDSGRLIRVGTGAMWSDVIQYTLARGLMPPVVNDYQYLSVGGTISMGGVGFMSHIQGLQAGHIEEVEVVTGRCHVMRASHDTNQDIFNLVRAGVGQFGVMSSVTIPLIQAPSEILTYKVFYTQEAGAQNFIREMKHLVEARVDMLHAFLKPSTEDCIAKIVGNESYATSPEEFRNSIEQGGKRGEVVYFLEIGIYVGADVSESRDKDIENLREILSDMSMIGGVYFEESNEVMSYLCRDPPVIEINKTHGSSVPHPSLATILSPDATMSLLEHHIQSPFRDDGMEEILIMPVKGNRSLEKGYDTPMFPFPDNNDGSSDDSISFFLLFLGSAVEKDDTSIEESIEVIQTHHRDLLQRSKAMGGKQYNYDTLTSERSEEEWREHYGNETWDWIVEGKRKYDPYNIFQSTGIHLFD